MLTNKLKELVEARAKLASLEQSIAAELKAELAGLPAQYGYESVADFLAAVKAASGARRGRKPGKAKAKEPAAPPASAAPKAKAGGKKRRTRAVITDATRADLKKLVAAGKTGSEIAKALKISLPSVQNIKKALGLVKKR